ncbi:MAG: transcriptional repressor [Defluviitaleaceae bacterium]|nr:transcriptional repressor [Defluviitaleaceae bacterium]
MRNTIQKKLVYAAVCDLNMHATAEQVFSHVTLTHPTVSKATIYRNLHQLTETGELINIGTFHGAAHYDHNCHKHHHFVCEKCRCVHDVQGDYSNAVLQSLNPSTEFDITDCNVTFTGICKTCEKSTLDRSDARG